ncbi:MAG: DEAD/DEAH box helicase [Thermomicrobiales bacterium]
MRFILKDYQADAVGQILKRLERAKEDYHNRQDLVAFALSATTGAGKTVMATAVIEALFLGSEDYDVEADPSAVILWVTDDPSLNEQTRYRIIECGDRLEMSRLKIIGDGGFDQERLEPGNVYFLNIQKLGSATTWVERSDKRTYTLWETIQNTIEDDNLTLYLVLDEAHRGMRSVTRRTEDTANRATIVQRLINGHNGIPPAPIVWGISATVQRFIDAMTAAHYEGRTLYASVQVDSKTVQESGLLKDTILLDFPDETGDFKTVLLRSALRDMRQASELWAEYATKEQLRDPVLPLMVLQVPNRPSETDLSSLLDLIHEEWPELNGDGVANVFGEHEDRKLGGYTVPYIAPQHVQEAAHVRVLLAKDAISTGWDCPRAEVLFSLRPATDRTHITQLLGRMVRTPLARRVDSDERLNSVACVLPLFNQATATDVAKVLVGEKVDRDDPDSAASAGSGRKALTSPVTMLWNPHVPKEIGEFLASLPSEAIPEGNVKPIKRLLNLSAAIAVDGLMDKPNEKAMNALFAVLDGQMAQHKDAVEQGVQEIYTAEIRRITSSVANRSVTETIREEVADERTVDDAYRGAVRALGAAVANAYAKRLALAESDDEDFDIHAAKAKLAALMEVEGVIGAVENEADGLARLWLNQLRRQIKSLNDERQAIFNEIRRQDRNPQIMEIVTPISRIENTKDVDDNLLPTRDRHLLADERGNFPVATLNNWEMTVVDAELSSDEVVAWYRNPSTPANDALQVPYLIGEKWKPMQPDFIFFSRREDGSLGASIVDPHGDHLADALPKLQGLAEFAVTYGNHFQRIEAISQIDKKELRMLNLLDPSVCKAVQEERTNATNLYRSDHAETYM